MKGEEGETCEVQSQEADEVVDVINHNKVMLGIHVLLCVWI